jgi:endonuclease/exonuclease/phosphatase family metal-dependent hydrolase
LLSWNAQWCRGIDGRVDPARIAFSARALCDFDVLCLQEIADNFPGLEGSRGENQLDMIAEALPGYSMHYAAAVDVDGGTGSRSRFGNLIASRLPVLQVFRHALPWPPDPGVASMPRVALEAVVSTRWGPLRVVTTHLEYYSQKLRLAQVEALRALHAQAFALSRHPRASGPAGEPFEARPMPASAVLAGDFNFRPGSVDYTRLTAAFSDGTPSLHDAWTRRHPGAPHPPTFRLHEPDSGETPYCCDFVFVSEDLLPRLGDVRVDADTRASDHQPVAVELKD